MPLAIQNFSSVSSSYLDRLSPIASPTEATSRFTTIATHVSEIRGQLAQKPFDKELRAEYQNQLLDGIKLYAEIRSQAPEQLRNLNSSEIKLFGNQTTLEAVKSRLPDSSDSNTQKQYKELARFTGVLSQNMDDPKRQSLLTITQDLLDKPKGEPRQYEILDIVNQMDQGQLDMLIKTYRDDSIFKEEFLTYAYEATQSAPNKYHDAATALDAMRQVVKTSSGDGRSIYHDSEKATTKKYLLDNTYQLYTSHSFTATQDKDPFAPEFTDKQKQYATTMLLANKGNWFGGEKRPLYGVDSNGYHSALDETIEHFNISIPPSGN